MILNFDGKLLIAVDTCVHRLSPCVGAALACQETSWNGFAALHTAQRLVQRSLLRCLTRHEWYYSPLGQRDVLGTWTFRSLCFGK